MRKDIQHDIVARLIADYEMIERGKWLQRGICPHCGKKELFAHVEQPLVVRCGRANKCGWEEYTKTLYPDVFASFNRLFVATQTNPNATADAYMQYARGFDLASIKGWYRQGGFWHPDANKGTATVRFDIDRAHDIYMERFVEEILISDEFGEKKPRRAHYKGAYRGLWWQPPDLQINHGDTIWLVEGCLDAIALQQNGQKAVATLSCVNYPDKQFAQHTSKKVTWVWALDNDPAGRRYLRKFIKRGREEGLCVQAAQIPQKNNLKTDWNDCHISQRLSEKHREEYLYHGSLLIAKSALDKALLIWNRKNMSGFCFDFNRRMYWFDLDVDKFNKATESIASASDASDKNRGHKHTAAQIRTKAAEQSGTLSDVANCQPSFLYYQSNKLTDESWYYCRVQFPHNGKTIKNTFTGGQVASAPEFKKRLLSIAPGGLFSGNAKQLDWLVKHHIHNIKVVDTIDFIGYSKAHKAYVFNDLAVSQGKTYKINDEDFFEIGKIAIKSLNQGFHLSIGDRSDYRADWTQMVYRAFGGKGLVAVSFWMGSLFAEQIRAIHKSFPFLEIIGEPGGGKTTLVEFMWKLLGKEDEEGFDPTKSSFAGVTRKFSQVSNLPVVLIEADREASAAKLRGFNWDELKTAYNGRASSVRGVKNNGNETYEPLFRGAIVISQNTAVSASEAVLQRIVHLCLDRSGHSAQSKSAADEMNLLVPKHLSFFLHQAVQNEAQIMESVKSNTPVYERQLLSLTEIKSVRVAKNHAQIMSLATAFSTLLDLPSEQRQSVQSCIEQMAIERQQALELDHPVVQQFWETYEYLNDGNPHSTLNHSRNDQLIAINLNHFTHVAAENKQEIPPLIELKNHLKTSKERKFYAIKPVNSALNAGDNNVASATVKCWVFSAGTTTP